MKALPGNEAKPIKNAHRKEIRALMIALCDDDRSGLPRLQELSRLYPKEFVCDIASIARSVFAKHLFPEAKDDDEPNARIRTELQAQIVLNALELAGENPSPARRLCAEVAAYAWAENWILCSTNVCTESTLTIRRRTAANRRFLYSLKTLAQIEQAEQRPRRMVQVNVATV